MSAIILLAFAVTVTSQHPFDVEAWTDTPEYRNYIAQVPVELSHIQKNEESFGLGRCAVASICTNLRYMGRDDIADHVWYLSSLEPGGHESGKMHRLLSKVKEKFPELDWVQDTTTDKGFEDKWLSAGYPVMTFYSTGKPYGMRPIAHAVTRISRDGFSCFLDNNAIYNLPSSPRPGFAYVWMPDREADRRTSGVMDWQCVVLLPDFPNNPLPFPLPFPGPNTPIMGLSINEAMIGITVIAGIITALYLCLVCVILIRARIMRNAAVLMLLVFPLIATGNTQGADYTGDAWSKIDNQWYKSIGSDGVTDYFKLDANSRMSSSYQPFLSSDGRSWMVSGVPGGWYFRQPPILQGQRFDRDSTLRTYLARHVTTSPPLENFGVQVSKQKLPDSQVSSVNVDPEGYRDRAGAETVLRHRFDYDVLMVCCFALLVMLIVGIVATVALVKGNRK